MIKLEGTSLDEFCELLIKKSQLDSEIVEEIMKQHVPGWLGISYSCVTYAFVYLSDLIREFEDACDEEDDDEQIILSTLEAMKTDEDYFIVFND